MDGKENGFHVSALKWKGSQEYRSITYSQSVFELNTSGRTVLSLPKIGEIPMVYHRDVDATMLFIAVLLLQSPFPRNTIQSFGLTSHFIAFGGALISLTCDTAIARYRLIIRRLISNRWRLGSDYDGEIILTRLNWNGDFTVFGGNT